MAAPRQRRRAAKPGFDPQSLVTEIDHRDDELLAQIARANHIYDRFDAARARGRTAYDRTIKELGRESMEMLERIASIPALTREGLYQKASFALRGKDGDPDQPSGGFRGYQCTALSALFDILAAGKL